MPRMTGAPVIRGICGLAGFAFAKAGVYDF